MDLLNQINSYIFSERINLVLQNSQDQNTMRYANYS